MRTLPQPSPVRSLAFLPGEPRLAFARGYSILAWDYAKEGRGSVRRREARHGYQIRFVGCSPDGGRMITVGGDRKALVWERGVEMAADQWDLDDTVQAAALSPDGNLLAVATGQVARSYLADAALVTIFDADRYGPVARLQLAHVVARSLAFAPDGARISIGINRVHAILWEPNLTANASAPRKDVYNPFRGWSRRGSLPQREPLVYGNGAIARAMAFSPDGRLLATTSGSRIIIWDLESHARIRTITGHEKMVTALAFVPAGGALASASQDGTLRFWDAATGSERAHYAFEMGKLTSIAFSPDATLAAAGGERGISLVELDERILEM